MNVCFEVSEFGWREFATIVTTFLGPFFSVHCFIMQSLFTNAVFAVFVVFAVFSARNSPFFHCIDLFHQFFLFYFSAINPNTLSSFSLSLSLPLLQNAVTINCVSSLHKQRHPSRGRGDVG
jgi:hypothetical protein